MADLTGLVLLASELSSGPGPGMSPPRILVVEDEALIMMATCDALVSLGCEVVRARNATVALAAIDGDGGLAAMLTDVNLPDMDGQALTAEARRRRPGLPVIFATGYRMKLAPEMEAAGPTAVLSKPYLPDDLDAALKKVLPG